MARFLDIRQVVITSGLRYRLTKYWLVNKPNLEISPYSKYSSFPVFRNIMGYGATGSGATVYLLQVSRYFARRIKNFQDNIAVANGISLLCQTIFSDCPIIGITKVAKSLSPTCNISSSRHLEVDIRCFL